MDLSIPPDVERLAADLEGFVDGVVVPAEGRFEQELAAAPDRHHVPPVLLELQEQAKRAGFWNLFASREAGRFGRPNIELAVLSDILGRSRLGAPVCNCSPPDVGNMQLLSEFGTAEQQERWLPSLLDGTYRSAFSKTEPGSAGSDPSNVDVVLTPDGDDLIIGGRKWWSTGASDPRCAVIFLVARMIDAPRDYASQSVVLVPMDTPGVTVLRDLAIFGYIDPYGHPEVIYEGVRVPKAAVLGDIGGAAKLAAARLAPERIAYCARAVGMAERALSLLTDRVRSRTSFGRALAEQGVVREWIARSRLRIDEARLLTLRAAWLADTAGADGSRAALTGVKVAVTDAVLWVVDRAIEAYGAEGLSNDAPLASMYAAAHSLRFMNGANQVLLDGLARLELEKGAHG